MTAPITAIGDLVALLAATGLDVDAVRLIVADALGEDLGERGVLPPGAGEGVDVTSVATIPADATGTAQLIVRRPGVLAGLPVAAYVLGSVCAEPRAGVASSFEIRLLAVDGDRVERGDVLAEITGNTRALLQAERVALNLLTLASGTATATAAWVEALAGTGAKVRDSRKTVPGLRMLQKYAVRVGGGVNHRMSLADQALIKDNHVLAAGGVVPAYEAVRAAYPNLHVQVEVTTPDQARDVVEAGANDVLLDNMDVEQMGRIVAEHAARDVVFEASGGLTLDRARAVAQCGVDYVAVGAITHSAPILDIALDLL